MRIALIQSHSIVGAFDSNVNALVAAMTLAARQGAELAVTCELAIPGYASRDRFQSGAYIDDNLRALDKLAQKSPIPALVGFCDRTQSQGSSALHNAAALVVKGAVTGVYHKVLLPTYDVFDESRYFCPGDIAHPLDFRGVKLGVSICEDIWANAAGTAAEHRYRRDPVQESVTRGAQVLVNLSASPFALGKRARWRSLLAAQAKKHQRALVVVNQVGGDDDLLFVGGSLVFDGRGELCGSSPEGETDTTTVEVDMATAAVSGGDIRAHDTSPEGETALLFDALVLGTRDYAKKCGFSSAVLGLSGGIDSAVTAAIASEALGVARVHGLALPSIYSSQHSRDDAATLARNLGMPFATIPIAKAVEELSRALAPLFVGCPEDVTEENLQARARGVLLMAMSNKHGHLLLNTGNKSEMAVGYCTLYGDMCGGLAILGDVYKTTVYQLAHEANRRFPGAIPTSTLEKPPSAELRAEQLDSDNLPPYPVLDEILRGFLEKQLSPEQIGAPDLDPHTVREVIALVNRAEHKRYQAPPVLRVTEKAFGPGRRMPLAAHFFHRRNEISAPHSNANYILGGFLQAMVRSDHVEDRKRILWYLKKVPPVAVLGPEIAARLAEKVELIEVRRREVIYLPGDPGRSIYFVNGGRVKISKVTRDGKALTLVYCGPSEIFGETCLVDGEPREEMAEAVENTVITSVERHDFEELLNNHASLGAYMTRLLAGRRRDLENKLETLVFRDVTSKLAELLLNLADEYGVEDARGTMVALKITHQELANLIGSTRETVSLTLSQFKRKQLICTEGRKVIISDAESLRALF